MDPELVRLKKELRDRLAEFNAVKALGGRNREDIQELQGRLEHLKGENHALRNTVMRWLARLIRVEKKVGITLAPIDEERP